MMWYPSGRRIVAFAREDRVHADQSFAAPEAMIETLQKRQLQSHVACTLNPNPVLLPEKYDAVLEVLFAGGACILINRSSVTDTTWSKIPLVLLA